MLPIESQEIVAMTQKAPAAEPDWLADYNNNGYHFPVQAMSSHQAEQYRLALEAVENQYSAMLDLKKLAIGHANALLPFADEITRLPSILEPVKTILGPDILVWNASFFIKNARTDDYISWHQDLTYWGLTDSHEVTAWVALSPSTIKSGCVKFVPGTHKQSIVEHRDTFHDKNLLSRGQELSVEVDEDDAVSVELQPGEMSLHHGQVFHGSHKNRSNHRRIGLAIRYITPDMKQTTNDKTNATLVAGHDNYGHFNLISTPHGVLNAENVAAVQKNIELSKKFLFANSNTE